MKKIFSGILAAFMTVGVCAFASGCGETIENGSKIEKCTITFDVDGKEQAINFKLYMNIATNTIGHFKHLAEKGYYDGSRVSDVNNAIEFGAYDSQWNTLDEKYASIINATYVDSLSDKEIYTKKFTINGEFEVNGYKYEGTKLDLREGALVLKRGLKPVEGETAADYLEAYDTGKGVMSITFAEVSADAYVNNATSFAILGKVVKNDASGDVKSSYTRLKAILQDYKKNDAEEKFYYFSYEPDATDKDEIVDLDKAIEKYGREYMVETDGNTYAKGADGEYNVKISSDNELGKIYLDAIGSKKAYVSLRPSKDITIKSVVFSK